MIGNQPARTASKWLGWSRKQWLVILFLLVMSTGGVWAMYQRPQIRDVLYDPCEISYGDIVGEWSGDSDDSWNKEGMHYQVRKFSMEAHAPDVFFPNTIELDPERISTGGDYACKQDFEERIDTAADKYKWQGARATSVRLGVPDFGETNGNGSYFEHNLNAQTNTNLSQPVFDGPGRRAAVWVDDAGSAELTTGDEFWQLWCINYEPCNDITDQELGGRAQVGQGYQFVESNCPTGLSCESEWYDNGSFDALRTEEDKALPPFDLRLNAVSTYASTVGVHSVLVFAYPMQTELEVEASIDLSQFDPGDSFDIDLEIHRFGPYVNEVTIAIDTSNQPASVPENGLSLDEEQIRKLNAEDGVRLSLPVSLSAGAARGQCHTLEISVKADNDHTDTTSAASVKYCINTAITTYTYSVRTRGSITSDLGNFSALAAGTLSDSRGWVQAGVAFTRVSSGGDFTLWLAAPDQMTSFSPYCSAEYSCRVGRDVIINDHRWENATEPWNKAGGSLRDYRHMVVNHEVGHFLGHGHYNCQGPNQLAPVMQQQSIDLQGCRFNPWPLRFEISST